MTHGASKADEKEYAFAMPSVLLVEDEPLSRRNLAALLQGHGYAVRDAENGEDAIDLLKRMVFDVVITDLVLPGELTGLDVLMFHRSVAPNKGALLITGFGSDPLEERARSLGIDYLSKPINLDALLLKIKEIIGR